MSCATLCYMETRRVGVRELRQNLSKYLDRIKRGERLEVTEHGRPVAVLAPLGAPEGRLDRLVAAGRVTRPATDLLSVLPPKGPPRRRSATRSNSSGRTGCSAGALPRRVRHREARAQRARDAGLGEAIRADPEVVSSALSWTEVVRAARRRGCGRCGQPRSSAGSPPCQCDGILRDAAELAPASLRTLDAIYFASARSLGEDIDAVITYDERMIEAAASLALTVRFPGLETELSVRDARCLRDIAYPLYT